ncbi:MAG TPA: ectoine/hydroxyectoine ABC transporter permease subunit EhuC [Euzebya sp.]|nr:ectoine/hydroxyectoine ABC transporter permease subunit EhuC [Euzebya sp.]
MDSLFLTPSAYQRLLEGTVITLQVLAGAVLLGTVLSFVFGIARLSTRRWARVGALVYIEFARGVSAIILLFWMFFAVPILFGLGGWSPMTSGILALGINMGAYGAEIVRGAVQSVPKGQSEATVALNLTPTQRLRHVIIPQAVPVILPPFGNLVIEILKGTALVSLITLSDLAFEAQKLRVSAIGQDTPVLYLNVLIMYFVLAQLLMLAFRWAERRSAATFGDGAPLIEPEAQQTQVVAR